MIFHLQIKVCHEIDHPVHMKLVEDKSDPVGLAQIRENLPLLTAAEVHTAHQTGSAAQLLLQCHTALIQKIDELDAFEGEHEPLGIVDRDQFLFQMIGLYEFAESPQQ